MQGHVSHQIIQCLGCKSVSFRKISTDTEDYDYDENNKHYYNETITYYPYHSSALRQIDTYLLPQNIQKIYTETKQAIDIEQNILAGIGIRALIETVCTDKEAAGYNLRQKIDWLHSQSLITKEGLETLHQLRTLGNEAAHQVKALSKSQLLLAIQIVEHLLEGTYIIPSKFSKTFVSQPDVDEL